MAQAYLNFTDLEVQLLQKVAEAWNDDTLLTTDEINNVVLAIGSAFKATPNIQAVSIASGIATVERSAKITYASIDTEGQTATDNLITINGTDGNSFVDLDILIIKAEASARQVVVLEDAAGNLTVNNGTFTLVNDTYLWAGYYFNNQWQEFTRFPNGLSENLNLTPETIYIASGAISPEYNFIDLYGELTGETKAQATETITGLGAAAQSISVFVDEGSGAFLIGSVSYLVAPASTTAVANDLCDPLVVGSITNLGIYSATNVGAIITIEPPAGRGSAANAYIISETLTGGMTATNSGTFGGGIDGSEADDDLDTINATFSDVRRLIMLKNVMSSNSITLTTSGNISAAFTLGPAQIAFLVGDGTTWTPYNPLQSVGVGRAAAATPVAMLSSDRIITVDSSGGDIDVDLVPVADFPAWTEFTVKKTDIANNVTLNPDGAETIEGAASLVLASTDSVDIFHDGTEWWIK